MARPPEYTPETGAEIPEDSGAKSPGQFPRWWEPYFAALSDCGVKLYACNACKIDESAPRKWLAINEWAREEFNAREAVALTASQQHLVMEARRRARFGTEKPILYKGRLVRYGEEDGPELAGHPIRLREYSDTLLMFLIKAGEPEVYRERFDVSARVAVSGIDDLLAATDEGEGSA